MATHSFWAVAAAGIDPGLNDTYARLAPDNKIWQEIARTGRPMADWMVMPKSTLVGSPLYSEWFAPQAFHGVMAAPVIGRLSLSGVVVAFNSKRRGDFEQDDLDDLADFAPHLGRAVALRFEREQLLADLSAAKRFLDDNRRGVLLLDAELRVLYANDVAQALLEKGDGLKLRNHRLSAQGRAGDGALRELLRPAASVAASGPQTPVVVNRTDRRPLLLRITPIAPSDRNGLLPRTAWLVKIIDPETPPMPDPDVLQRLFSLTAMEARIVSAMVPPRSESQVAAELRLAKNTIRWHLHNAYHKLGVKGRDQLMFLLARYGLD